MTSINPSLNPQNISQTTTGAASPEPAIDAQAAEFQPIDALDSGHVVVQQFLSASQWGKKEYLADPRHPTLLPPEAIEEGFTPLEPSWQKEINRQFKHLIKEKMIEKGKQHGSEKGGSELSESHIEGKVNAVLHAAAAGKTSTLSEEDQQHVADSTKKIQKKFHLPIWKFGTIDPKALTPTQALEPPIEVTRARGETLIANIDNLSDSIQKAADKMVKETPKEDPNALAVGDLVKIITQAISELKQVLQDMQLAESKISSKMVIIKKEQKEEHLQKIYDAIEKQKEIERKQRKQRKVAGIMKIVAPIVSALVAVAAIVFAVASLGTAAAPLAIAVAVVSTILFAYTVVDTQEGYTQQAMEEFNKAMDEIEPKWAAELTKASILAIAAMILILAVIASGGSAAATAGGAAASAGTASAAAGATAATAASATAATTAATTTASAVAKEVACQLAIQSSMMFIMSSNILPDLVVDACVASGAVSKDDEKAIMIIQVIVMALTLILCMEAMAKGQGLIGTGLSAAKSGAQSAITNTQTLVKNLSEATVQNTKTAIEKSLAEFNKVMMEMIKNLMDNAKAAMASASQTTVSGTASAASERIKAGFKFAYDEFSYIYAGAKEGLTNPNVAKIAHSFEGFFQVAGLGVNAGYSIYLGTISLQLVDLFKQLGNVEKEKEALQALIQIFEKLLTSLQADQTGKAEWINNLTQTMDNMYASESIMSTKITQQYTA